MDTEWIENTCSIFNKSQGGAQICKHAHTHTHTQYLVYMYASATDWKSRCMCEPEAYVATFE